MDLSNSGSLFTGCNIQSENGGAMKKTAKTLPSGTVSPKSFKSSFRDAVAEMNREKMKIGLQELENMRARRELFLKQLMQTQQKEKKPEDPFEKQRKCMEIARKIMKGCKVTSAELKYLAQNDPKLLYIAMLYKSDVKRDNEEEVDVEESGGESEEESAEENNAQSVESAPPADVGTVDAASA